MQNTILLQDCDQIIQLCKRVARALFIKGEALQNMGKEEEAESVLEIANTLQPEHEAR